MIWKEVVCCLYFLRFSDLLALILCPTFHSLVSFSPTACQVVLPRIGKQIISCKDKMAQQYLMECIVQVSALSPSLSLFSSSSHAISYLLSHDLFLFDSFFVQIFPDEFHLITLDELMAIFPQLEPTVNIKLILVSLLTRLTNYASR